MKYISQINSVYDSNTSDILKNIDWHEIKNEVLRNGFSKFSINYKDVNKNNMEPKTILEEVSAKFGVLVPQNKQNDMFRVVKDKGLDYSDPTVRGHDTNAGLKHHSDRCDLNVMLYEQVAVSGGQLVIIDSRKIYQHIRTTTPEVIAVLSKSFPQDLRNESLTQQRWCMAPIFWRSGEGIYCRYIRRFIEDSQEHKNCPRLTREQVQALDTFDAAVKIVPNVEFHCQPGDIVILDNHRVLHARKPYVDSEKEHLKRTVHRTWVANKYSCDLPQDLQPIFGSTKGGTIRGGVYSKDSEYSNLIGLKITD